MTATFILNTITKFYTTELHLKTPDSCNDWANYSLSYVQYFVGKEAIQCQNGKLERVDPKNVEEKFPWVPSAIKSTAYFFLAIPFVVLGTVARILSLDSKEIADAIFADRASLPPRKELKQPKKLKYSRPRPFPAAAKNADAKRSDEAQASTKPEDDQPLAVPNAEQNTKKIMLDYLKKIGKGLQGAAAAPFKAIEGMRPEDIKSAMEDQIRHNLGILLTFDEELLRHAQNPHTPNYAAIAAFIETKRKDTLNYQAPFFLRDYFVMSLPIVKMLGIKLNSQDIARWEALDAQCQVLMNSPELKAYLEEPPPVYMQGEALKASFEDMKSQAFSEKAQVQDIMSKLTKFFNQLFVQLKQKPVDRSAILKLLNGNENGSSYGMEAFTFACTYKAQTRILTNFYDEPLFSRFIDLYTSCFLQLHAAKFTIPSQFNPLCRDLIEQPRSAAPAPSAAAPSAEPAISSPLEQQIAGLLKYVIAFSEELLQNKSVDAMKAFIESKRKDTSNYKSPFYTRCYLICTWNTLIEMGVPLNLKYVNQWKALDTQLELTMQSPELKSYLDEDAPAELQQVKSILLEGVRTSILRDKAKHEEIIKHDTLFFQSLLTHLRKTPLLRTEIDTILDGPKKTQVSDVFFYGKLYLAVKGHIRDILIGEMYESYFKIYLACITQLQALNFETPFLPMSSLQAEPKPAAVAQSAPPLSSQQITRINQELKTITDFFEELLEITPSGTAEWLNAQKSKTEAKYCYPFHWSKTNAETLKTHRNHFNQALMKKWEILYPKCFSRLEDNKLQVYLDETPESPGDCKQS